MRNSILNALGITSYEQEYNELVKEYENLKRAHETVQAANDILARQIIDLEDRVELLSTQPNKYVWEHCRKFEKEHTAEMEHRAFANGRASAYSELGIWRLDAIADGNCLVRLQDGSIVELIADDLVDVTEPPCEPKIDVLKGEIIIDDLQDVGA